MCSLYIPYCNLLILNQEHYADQACHFLHNLENSKAFSNNIPYKIYVYKIEEYDIYILCYFIYDFLNILLFKNKFCTIDYAHRKLVWTCIVNSFYFIFEMLYQKSGFNTSFSKLLSTCFREKRTPFHAVGSSNEFSSSCFI